MALGQSLSGNDAAECPHSPAGSVKVILLMADAGLVSNVTRCSLTQCEWWHVDVLCSDSATWHLL